MNSPGVKPDPFYKIDVYPGSGAFRGNNKGKDKIPQVKCRILEDGGLLEDSSVLK